MTEACRRICGYLGCECQVFSGEKSADELLELFAELRVQGKSQGFSPIFIIPDETLLEAFELCLEDNDAEDSAAGMAEARREMLEQAAGLDPWAMLDANYADLFDAEENLEELLGDFLEAEPSRDLDLGDLDGRLYPEIILAKIPAPAPELAAWVPMGGFNDCPAPAGQVALFRHWYEEYGASPALVSYDVWQLTVEKPPLDDEAAEDLARQHFAFCPDMVLQAPEGLTSIRALASNLKESAVWGFWWD